MKSFLEYATKGMNRVIEGETQMLSDLLIMLEKVLFHGFKSSIQRAFVTLRTPDSELWAALMKISKSGESMKEATTCIDTLDSLSSNICKVRAFLRLAMMQKKLSDFFERIINSSVVGDFYEPWALLRHEEGVVIAGALVGLRVVECSMILDDHLQEQPPSINLASYIKLQTVGNDPEPEEEKDEAKRIKVLLDQNAYLEERNRLLETTIEDLKRHVENLKTPKTGIEINNEAVSYKPHEACRSPESQQTENLKAFDDLKKANVDLESRLEEMIDTLAISQQQTDDKSKICTDLYEKLRLSEECVVKLERDFLTLKGHYNKDKQLLQDTIESLEKKNELLLRDAMNKSNADESMKSEYQRKCEQYSTSMELLDSKQKQLAAAADQIAIMQNEKIILQRDARELPFLKEELKEMRMELERERSRADESDRTLEELGGRLSESRLRMVELAEELLPLTDAQWAKDSDVSNCSACEIQFTLAKRKHHCRMCGSIYCASCSEGRIKLPSNPKPARVCDNCFTILKNRNSSHGNIGAASP